MSIEIKVPELGENIEGGDVVNVLVREGQAIAANQGIVEMETDKAVIEIPCSQAGTIAKLHVKKGDHVKVGQALITIEPAEGGAGVEAAPVAKPTAAAAPAAKPPAAPNVVPAEGKAPIAEPAPAAPVAPPAAAVTGGPLPAGPAARRVARELGVDLRRVAGSGKHGRITAEDVRAASSAAPAAKSGGPSVGSEPVVPPGEPSQDAWGPVRRDRISQIRRTIAAHMVRSATTIPHVTNFDDADITDLERLRKNVPSGFLGANVKLTLMPFLMKAVAIALRRHPVLNSSLDEENGQIVYKEYVHLGVAVDTPRGLVVPVIRDVDRMNVPEIARALVSLADRARAAQFAIEELRGGTFTLSNLGAVGGTYSTPIINYPEVAVLLLGRSRWMPVVREEKIETRLMLPLSLSYDHRLVDGAAAARFLNEVIAYLQSPGMLMLA